MSGIIRVLAPSPDAGEPVSTGLIRFSSGLCPVERLYAVTWDASRRIVELSEGHPAAFTSFGWDVADGQRWANQCVYDAVLKRLDAWFRARGVTDPPREIVDMRAC